MSSSASIYIHIPFCRTRCSYCDFFSTACGKKGVSDSYVSALCREIQLRFRYSGYSSVHTVYIGGGTPSLLTPEQLKKISDSIYSLPGVSLLREFSMEVNPDDVTRSFILSAAASGITRLSCGIQAFEDSVLSRVKRRSSGKRVLEALDCISEHWKGDLSVDLIAALPGQTEEGLCKGLKRLSEYPVDHVSLYSLTIEPETPLGRQVESGTLSYDFENADRMWLTGRDVLESLGFRQYEVSNFCKPGKECLHNLVYWNLEGYLGCGAGATGTLYGKNAVRFTGTTDIQEYTDFWLSESACIQGAPGEREELNLEVQSFEFFMMGLRTLRGVSLDEYRRRFGYEVPEKIRSEMADWEQRGTAYFYRSGNELYFSLGSNGILFLNDFLRSII